jgi:hypothetical protein
MYIAEKVKQNENVKKYVALEAFSTTEFGLKFIKFYQNDLKLQIQRIPGAKFKIETRSWVLSLTNYESMLERLKNICSQYEIIIQELPTFVVNLILHPTPCTGPQS